MKRRKKNFRGDVPTSILIPGPLQRATEKRAAMEDRSFGAIVRLALKKELGFSVNEEPEKEEKGAR